MKIGRYTKLVDGLRTTPVPPVQLAPATPLDASTGTGTVTLRISQIITFVSFSAQFCCYNQNR